MKSPLATAIPVSGLTFDHRTANGRLANTLLQSSRLPAADANFRHGRITAADDRTMRSLWTAHGNRTGNAELFASTHYSEPMTDYAIGWSDPEGYDALVEFLAPNFQAPGELFEHLEFNNAEEFLSDGSNDDLRAINASFKTVDYTQAMDTRRVNNRGLRIELDWDRVKGDPMWQQRYTAKLLNRLKRNQARRAAALVLASGTSDGLVFASAGTGVQPDIQLNAQKILSTNSSGIKPNRLLIGEDAWQLRLAAYGASASLSAAAGLTRTVEQVGALLSMQAMLDTGRYQTGATKAQIIGANIAFFTGSPGADMEDPTNFKLAWVNCQNGQRWAVYVRQLDVKKWEIVVEHYEALFAASVLGVIVCPITAS